MYLLWLRVAAILYAADVSPSSRPCSTKSLPWRKTCVHLGGMAFFFHFVSVVEMLVQAHRWMPVGVREIESLLGFAVAGLFFLVWWLYDAISLGIFALPATFFLVFIPALGPDRFRFPSQGVWMSWLVAHIIALLLAYAALCFSLLASMLYLVQERRIKSKPKPGKTQRWQPLDWLPPLDTLERMALATLEFGFPCMTVGLVIGSVLVQETSLGAAYFLDPNILASFVMWIVYVDAPPGSPRHGSARPQGRLCLRRGAGRDDGGLGRELLQPGAQVRSPMTLALIGVNHKTAPIALREKIAIGRDELAETTRALASTPGVAECMIVSTCNRVELLAAVESADAPVAGFLSSHFGIEAQILAPHLYEYRDKEAVSHLFRMAASLDSMVVGEPQILGQVKEAFAVARAAGTVSGQLGTPAAERVCRGQKGAQRDGNRLEFGFHRVGGRRYGAQNLRLARRAARSSWWARAR